jgi:hypothetical protein
MTKIEAIEDLIDGGTHVFYRRSYCEMICEPFGIAPNIRTHHATRSDPKGLTLNDGADKADGMASWDLAAQIARHLGLKLSESMGRGSAQRENTDRILKHLKDLEASA